MTDKVLVAGCGDVGNTLATRLLDDSCEVWGIRRQVSALAPGVRPWRVDLTDVSTLGSPPAPFDYVFYTASADRRDEAHYRAIYVDGLRDLLRCLEAASCPIHRVFFTSSTAVYGQNRGEWVDESSSTEPSRFNGHILLEAEKIVRAVPSFGVSVRLSGIYGPSRTRLIEKVWEGKAQAGASWTNRIHVEDCAAVLHHLMRFERPAEIYLGSDDEPATTADVAAWLSDRLGVAPPPEARLEGLNKRCRNTLLRDTGYRFRYPTFRDGYAPIVDDFLRDRAAR